MRQLTGPQRAFLLAVDEGRIYDRWDERSGRILREVSSEQMAFPADKRVGTGGAALTRNAMAMQAAGFAAPDAIRDQGTTKRQWYLTALGRDALAVS